MTTLLSLCEFVLGRSERHAAQFFHWADRKVVREQLRRDHRLPAWIAEARADRAAGR